MNQTHAQECGQNSVHHSVHAVMRSRVICPVLLSNALPCRCLSSSRHYCASFQLPATPPSLSRYEATARGLARPTRCLTLTSHHIARQPCFCVLSVSIQQSAGKFASLAGVRLGAALAEYGECASQRASAPEVRGTFGDETQRRFRQSAPIISEHPPPHKPARPPLAHPGKRVSYCIPHQPPRPLLLYEPLLP